jgi:hypothetical protein
MELPRPHQRERVGERVDASGLPVAAALSPTLSHDVGEGVILANARRNKVVKLHI